MNKPPNQEDAGANAAPSAKEVREQRLAENLRQNLRRRKAAVKKNKSVNDPDSKSDPKS